MGSLLSMFGLGGGGSGGLSVPVTTTATSGAQGGDLGGTFNSSAGTSINNGGSGTMTNIIIIAAIAIVAFALLRS